MKTLALYAVEAIDHLVQPADFDDTTLSSPALSVVTDFKHSLPNMISAASSASSACSASFEMPRASKGCQCWGSLANASRTCCCTLGAHFSDDEDRQRTEKLARRLTATQWQWRGEGRANGVITPDLAMKVGQATGIAFRRGDHRHLRPGVLRGAGQQAVFVNAQ